MTMVKFKIMLFLLLLCDLSFFGSFSVGVVGEDLSTVVGDPGMKNDNLRLAIEAWNYCNKVGEEAPAMGSPRAADCFNVNSDDLSLVEHNVTEADNRLSVGDPFPAPFRGQDSNNVNDTDLYAVQKELYLGSKCEVHGGEDPWTWAPDVYQFWKINLKNGNFDTREGLCPKNGEEVGPFDDPNSNFSCFGKACMNQPLMFHNYTSLVAAGESKRGNGKGGVLRGSFYGTYDLDADFAEGVTKNISYYSVSWDKEIGDGKSWVFHHILRTSEKYPSLMLNFKSDINSGNSTGYPYQSRGMAMRTVGSILFKVKFNLTVMKGGGPNSQFKLLEMGGCMKNDGQFCDGDTTTDVTRLVQMIINPITNTTSQCSPTNLKACPPFHIATLGEPPIYRSDTDRFPYGAYQSYCAPANAKHLEEPYELCDPYSSPTQQEIIKILPHPAWESFGFPAKQGDGWIGDSRSWEMDAGRLARTLFFYQYVIDPNLTIGGGGFIVTTGLMEWYSMGVGAEIYESPDQVAEWTVSDLDILERTPQPE